jgi:hypothetical protein
MKGLIGVDSVHISLIANATVTDSAHVLWALGVKKRAQPGRWRPAAMWISGSYKIGPGRLLPNAVVLTHASVVSLGFRSCR